MVLPFFQAYSPTSPSERKLPAPIGNIMGEKHETS